MMTEVRQKPIFEVKMTKRTVGYLAVGVLMCAGLGLWATFAVDAPATRRVVGAAAIAAFVLAVAALRRRGWTRLPLGAAGVFAVLLAMAVIGADDDPMSIPLLGYVLYNTLIIFAALPAALILLSHEESSSRPD